MQSITKNLERTLGGKWHYEPASYAWWCDDIKRYVARVSAGVDEFDNKVGPAEYWLYEVGKPPKRAERYVRKNIPLPEDFLHGLYEQTLPAPADGGVDGE